jgi:IPT/TIG domain-containing protein
LAVTDERATNVSVRRVRAKLAKHAARAATGGYKMATRQKERDDDTDVMERPTQTNLPTAQSGAATEQQQPGVDALVMMTGGDPLTVTVNNPTPPTNLSYNNYGTPPTPAAAPFVDDGVVNGTGYGATTAIATPLSVNPPKGPASEATGTVVIDPDPNTSPSISVMGAYTNTPNASHPSSAAPAVTPTITSLSPNNLAGTGGTTMLLVNGTGFEPQSQIVVGGVPVTTFFIQSTQLSTQVAPKRTSAGTTAVTVVTGGVSSAASTWTFT